MQKAGTFRILLGLGATGRNTGMLDRVKHQGQLLLRICETYPLEYDNSLI